jgi:hypothetical protein
MDVLDDGDDEKNRLARPGIFGDIGDVDDGLLANGELGDASEASTDVSKTNLSFVTRVVSVTVPRSAGSGSGSGSRASASASRRVSAATAASRAATSARAASRSASNAAHRRSQFSKTLFCFRDKVSREGEVRFVRSFEPNRVSRLSSLVPNERRSSARFTSRFTSSRFTSKEKAFFAPRAGGNVPVPARLAAYGDASALQARRRVDRKASIARAVR